MTERLILVDVSFDGCDYREDDLAALNEEFSAVGVVHVSAGWAPAAGPAAAVQVIVTFVGSTLAIAVTSQLVAGAWTALVRAWRSYRERRRLAGGLEPRLSRLVFRASDFDVEIDGIVDLDLNQVLELLQLLSERRTSGALAGQPIRRVVMPVKKEKGDWRMLYEFEGCKGANLHVWWVQSRMAGPMLGYYDAKRDRWL
jgi:hypothetical protein